MGDHSSSGHPTKGLALTSPITALWIQTMLEASQTFHEHISDISGFIGSQKTGHSPVNKQQVDGAQLMRATTSRHPRQDLRQAPEGACQLTSGGKLTGACDSSPQQHAAAKSANALECHAMIH